MVMCYVFQHVTVTTEFQIRGLVKALSNDSILDWFSQTVQCNVLLPFAVLARGIQGLISRCVFKLVMMMHHIQTKIDTLT